MIKIIIIIIKFKTTKINIFYTQYYIPIINKKLNIKIRINFAKCYKHGAYCHIMVVIHGPSMNKIRRSWKL